MAEFHVADDHVALADVRLAGLDLELCERITAHTEVGVWSNY